MSSSNQNRAMVPTQSAQIERQAQADIVIIGNGIAGLTAAVESRHYEPDKRIVIITDQLHPTINTPALKQFAVAKLAREQLLAYPPGTERSERIHVVNARVEEIHAQSKYLKLDGNRAFGYNKLLIATGSHPIGLPDGTPGLTFDGVLMLHRLQDYLDLRRRIPEVREAVVIGGGVHANETVMGLLYWGIRVHWLIRGKTFMNKMLDETASEMVLQNVRRAGAIIHLETEVTGVIGRIGGVAGVITNTREMIPCEMVLTCTGTKPVTTLAKHCSVPMKHKNGILVDDKQRTSVRDIYAAGDTAALRNPQTGGYEPRAQWYSAVMQGRIAGAMMVDREEQINRSFGVPWHATHLGELSMLSVGEPLSNDSQVMTLTDTTQGNYRRITLLDDRLVGYLSVGMAQPDSLAIKRIIDEGLSVRNVTKALLKGNFDARGYFSQQGAIKTRTMSTRQLPPLSAPAPARSFPETGSVAPVIRAPAATQTPETVLAATPASPAVASVERNDIQPVVEQVQTVQTAQTVRQNTVRPLIYEEELSPFTGTLPALSQPERSTDAQQSVPAFAGYSSNRVEEEINPFTGNLPVIARQGNRTGMWPEVPSTSISAKRANRNLWEYTESY